MQMMMQLKNATNRSPSTHVRCIIFFRLVLEPCNINASVVNAIYDPTPKQLFKTCVGIRLSLGNMLCVNEH